MFYESKQQTPLSNGQFAWRLLWHFGLVAGLVFIVAAALIFTPMLHRLLHRFHWDDDSSEA